MGPQLLLQEVNGVNNEMLQGNTIVQSNRTASFSVFHLNEMFNRFLLLSFSILSYSVSNETTILTFEVTFSMRAYEHQHFHLIFC